MYISFGEGFLGLMRDTRRCNSKLSIASAAAPLGIDSLRNALIDMGVKKKISLLGSTGSIGTQTLDICREYPEQFQCVAMAAGSNLDLLVKQIIEFKPKVVSIKDSLQSNELLKKIRDSGITDSDIPELRFGESGIVDVATFPDSDIVVTGIVGCAGLLPTIAAIKAGKDIALANKETLIAGGKYYRRLFDHIAIILSFH